MNGSSVLKAALITIDPGMQQRPKGRSLDFYGERSRMHLCKQLVLLCAASSHVVVAAATETSAAVSVLVDAVMHSACADNWLESCRAEMEIVSSRGVKSPEEFAEYVKDVTTLIRKAYADSIDSVRESAEASLRNLPSLLAEKNKSSRSRVKVIYFKGDDFIHRRCVVINFDHATKAWGEPITSLGRVRRGGGWEGALWIPATRSVQLGSMEFAVPCDIRECGRLTAESVPTLLAAINKVRSSSSRGTSRANIRPDVADVESAVRAVGTTFELKGHQSYDVSASAVVIESMTDGKLAARYCVDASRGFVCPRIELFDSRGEKEVEWVSSGYFLHERSGVWFPTSQCHLIYLPGGEVGEKVDCRIEPGTLSVNEQIPGSELSITVPARTKIIDSRSGESAGYLTDRAVTLSFLDKGMSIEGDAFSRLLPTGQVGRASLFRGLASLSWKTWLAIVNGLILIALLGVFARRMVLARLTQRESRGRRDRR